MWEETQGWTCIRVIDTTVVIEYLNAPKYNIVDCWGCPYSSLVYDPVREPFDDLVVLII